MRKSLTFLLAVVVVAFGLPIASHANSSSRTSSVTGRAIDVSGRAVAAQRVELLRGTEVVDVVMTTAGGDWMFPSVSAGDYVVRMTINNTVAGVRVTVRPGQTLGGNLLVAPAAAAAPQFGILAGGLGGGLGSVVGIIASTAASVAGASAINTETVRLDPDRVETILNSLDAAQKLTFVSALIEALQAGVASGAFADASQVSQLIGDLVVFQQALQTGGNPSFEVPAIVAS